MSILFCCELGMLLWFKKVDLSAFVQSIDIMKLDVLSLYEWVLGGFFMVKTAHKEAVILRT